jgi:hypothetical protein
MGSGDPSGLQNRRELALLALVSSTLTRFRHPFISGQDRTVRMRSQSQRDAGNLPDLLDPITL